MSISVEALRHSARTLRRQPGYSVVVVLSLALAISLNTTMYAMLDALIHPRVDIRDPDHLFKIRMYGDYRFQVSTHQRDSLLRAGAPSIESIAWYDPVSGTGPRGTVVEAGDRAEDVGVTVVSHDYFDLMGPRV